MFEITSNTNELIWEKKVLQELSGTIVPGTKENWENLYTRLTNKIFQDKFPLHL